MRCLPTRPIARQERSRSRQLRRYCGANGERIVSVAVRPPLVVFGCARWHRDGPFVAGKLCRGILLGYGCLRRRLSRRAGRNVEFEMLAYVLACSCDGGNCGFRIGEQLRRRCSRRQVSDGIVADAERGEDAEPAHQHHDRG